MAHSDTLDLSVILVSWNTRKMTRACLESVYANLGDLNAEIILIDNASSDGSADMVADEFPHVRLVRNANNRGFAAANNQAFGIANGRVILLLNTDTLVHGNVLGKAVAHMDEHGDVGVLGPRVRNADGTIQPSHTGWPGLLDLTIMTLGLDRVGLGSVFDRYRLRRVDRNQPADATVISGCAMFVRREAMDAVGVLDESFFFFGEETDWCRRFANAGWRLRYEPLGVITHFGGGSVRSLNHRRDVMLTEATIRLHAKHGGPFAAFACRSILGTFNASRALLWTAVGALDGETARARGRHFRRVCGETLNPVARP